VRRFETTALQDYLAESGRAWRGGPTGPAATATRLTTKRPRRPHAPGTHPLVVRVACEVLTPKPNVSVDYNLIRFTEQCLSNTLRMEQYAQAAERDGDSELAEFPPPTARAARAPSKASQPAARADAVTKDLAAAEVRSRDSRRHDVSSRRSAPRMAP
jgi:hypothetical protein